MDHAHASTLLTRINRVFEGLGDGQGNPASALEVDLLREYVRRFYEALGAREAASQAASPAEAAKASTPAEDATKAQALQSVTRRPLQGHALRSAAKPGPAATPAPRPKPPTAKPPTAKPPTAKPPTAKPASQARQPQVPPAAPSMIEVPASVEEDVRRIEAVSPPDTAPAPAKREPNSKAGPINESIEPALRELFAVERGQDLSDKLASAPVADLTRAMALNARLVAQNQLFGKDASALRDTLHRLNGYDSYEQASASLVTTARQYDWTADERRGAARDFIKLVQRRYVAPN